MTDEEIEAVAAELAKVGGVAWYPGRTQGSLLRGVGERYRDRARVAIAALERLRARREGANPSKGSASEAPLAGERPDLPSRDTLRVEATVVYRPPGDRRAIHCRIKELREDRAYLVPCSQPGIGWVGLDNLQLLSEPSPKKAE
ncbi:hypothetical protein ILT44_04175 [Microvirga sp. BT689]|uniref:hypothetical protein n=1 Tax=Microvirga arvi TaxID=2778731 RepID=UPI00194FCF59|nr:hypothetical protein [Microvirga arvi]MBM6579372.1 hypothetical protein [Microvirga arvi]